MNFCPECGSSLNVGSVKFYHNCGKNLWQSLSNNTATTINSISLTESSSSNDEIFQDIMTEKEGQLKIETGQENISTTTIYNLGVNLEELVEKILKKKDYSTQRRLKLKGKSGALHEIDVFGKRKNKSLAVECKNYEQDIVVGIKEIRDFHSKLNDLHHDGDALFVTYGRFSSDTVSYANKYDIELWNGDKLSKIYLSMLIGRYGTSTSSTSSSTCNEIGIENALPVFMTFEEITRLNLENSSIAKIEGILIFKPYYIFEYKLDSMRMDKRGKSHRIRDEDYYILDAITEQILYESEKDDVSNYHQILFSTKRNKDKLEFENLSKKFEHSQICHDLKNIKPKIHYKISETPDYLIKVLEPDLSVKNANLIILEKIIQSNTKEISYDVKTLRNEVETKTMTIIPKKSEVTIKRSSLIYVPIWKIGFSCKDITYRRVAMAASKTIIVDEIERCSKDFSSLRFWTKWKITNALCQTCGITLCDDHIYKDNGGFYCKEHCRY